MAKIFVHRLDPDGDDGPDLVAVNRLGDVRSSRGRGNGLLECERLIGRRFAPAATANVIIRS